LKKHKPWFDKGCSELLDQRKQAKLQWLHDPSEINRDYLSNIRHKASRNFRNKKKEYLIDISNELATNSENKNIRDLYRGVNEFKRSYQPRSKLVKDENGDSHADFHILNRWKSYFAQLLNLHRVGEPSVPDPSPLEVEIAIAKLKRYKSSGSDQILAELI
jgi:hypothetical protein